MKKASFVFLFGTVMMILLSFSVFADTQFVDPIEDGFPKAYAHSDHMYYQYNDDMECSILVKQSDTGSPSTTEYIVYKLDNEIIGFSLDCMHVNGLGNGETDIKVYVSSDNTKWTEIPTKVTEQVFDEEVYIDFDHAYWLNSTVSNKESIPAGNTFIKIEIQPFTVPESCTWNTVIDTVLIATKDAPKDQKPTGGTASELESSIPSEDSTDSSKSEISQRELSEIDSSADAAAPQGRSVNGVQPGILIGLGVLCIAIASVVIIAVLKAKKSDELKKNEDDSSEEK